MSIETLQQQKEGLPPIAVDLKKVLTLLLLMAVARIPSQPPKKPIEPQRPPQYSHSSLRGRQRTQSPTPLFFLTTNHTNRHETRNYKLYIQGVGDRYSNPISCFSFLSFPN